MLESLAVRETDGYFCGHRCDSRMSLKIINKSYYSRKDLEPKIGTSRAVIFIFVMGNYLNLLVAKIANFVCWKLAESYCLITGDMYLVDKSFCQRTVYI